MADNLAYNATGAATVAADDIAGVHYQRVKVSIGADGSATDLAPGHKTADTAVGVVDGCNTALAGAAVSVSTTQAALPTSALANRRTITVQNRDASVSLYIGPTGVTTTTGLEVRPFASMTLPLGPSCVLYGIALSSINVRVLEAS